MRSLWYPNWPNDNIKQTQTQVYLYKYKYICITYINYKYICIIYVIYFVYLFQLYLILSYLLSGPFAMASFGLHSLPNHSTIQCPAPWVSRVLSAICVLCLFCCSPRMQIIALCACSQHHYKRGQMHTKLTRQHNPQSALNELVAPVDWCCCSMANIIEHRLQLKCAIYWIYVEFPLVYAEGF